MFSPKSLYRSRAGRRFYGTENVIWASFRPIGSTEKIMPIVIDFEERFFMSKKMFNFFFLILASTIKSFFSSFFARKRLNIQNQLGIALLRDFYIMALAPTP